MSNMENLGVTFYPKMIGQKMFRPYENVLKPLDLLCVVLKLALQN